MTCTECVEPVLPERLYAVPTAKTCSRDCSWLRQERLEQERIKRLDAKPLTETK